MPDSIKQIWKKLVARPRNITLLVVIGLLVLIIGLLMSPGQSAAPVNIEQALPAAAEDSTPAIPVPVPVPAPVPVPDQTTLDDSSANETKIAVQPSAKLVLIIDDLGYNAEAGERAIRIPGQITYAVIPYTPHGRTLADSAHRANKEVMLHAPMSNLAGLDLGPGGLTLLQNKEEFVQTLRLALAAIPHIQGLNNHTGSELMAAAQPMQWLMQELKQRNLYFVDSVTTNVSVAAATAEEYQVPSLSRHVFLDNVQSAEAIDLEFKRALALAHKQGFAVAIGHPYAATLDYLETALLDLPSQNIELVSASTMIAEKANPTGAR